MQTCLSFPASSKGKAKVLLLTLLGQGQSKRKEKGKHGESLSLSVKWPKIFCTKKLFLFPQKKGQWCDILCGAKARQQQQKKWLFPLSFCAISPPLPLLPSSSFILLCWAIL